MKKYLFLAATAIVALASCSDNSLVGEGVVVPVENELTPITFSSSSAATTRAEGKTAADSLRDNFVVKGVKYVGETPTVSTVFDHYNVNYTDGTSYTSTTNTTGWEYVGIFPNALTSLPNPTTNYQTVKYWDYSASMYDFIAFSKGSATAVYADGNYTAGTNVLYTAITPSTMTSSTGGAYTIKGKAKDITKTFIADLTTAYNADNDYQNDVKLSFRSIASKVRVGLYETVPGYSVKNVVFYTANNTKATDGNAYLYTEGEGNVFNTEGTCTIYYPTTGTNNKGKADYNKAHVAFTKAESGTDSKMSFGAFAYNATNNPTFQDKAINETSEHVYLGRSSAEATFSGSNATNVNYYTLALPNETGAELTLKVDYTLLATDGSQEVINVTGATAKVPAQYAQWKAGFAYTYLFKISDRTNGYTGPTTSPAGLYPITFDAVVTETEDGIQETITTVSEPSITTFGVKSGKFTTGTDEYKSGTTIYVTCLNADGSVFDPTLGGNTHIFNVTSTNEAVYPITEASVAESQQHPAGNKITVTHECCGYNSAAKVTSVPAEDGNTKTINAIKFTPTTSVNKTFAVRYTMNTPVVETYSSSVPALDASLEGYYRDTYTKCSSGDKAAEGITYYTEYVKDDELKEGDLVANYYKWDTGGNKYVQCGASETAATGVDYYSVTPDYYVAVTGLTPGTSDVSNYYTKNTKMTLCDSDEKANGVTTYYLPATYSTAPAYAYKIIKIKP